MVYCCPVCMTARLIGRPYLSSRTDCCPIVTAYSLAAMAELVEHDNEQDDSVSEPDAVGEERDALHAPAESESVDADDDVEAAYSVEADAAEPISDAETTETMPISADVALDASPVDIVSETLSTEVAPLEMAPVDAAPKMLPVEAAPEVLSSPGENSSFNAVPGAPPADVAPQTTQIEITAETPSVDNEAVKSPVDVSPREVPPADVTTGKISIEADISAGTSPTAAPSNPIIGQHAPSPSIALRPISENVLTLRRMLREAMEELAQLTAESLKLQLKVARMKYGSAAESSPGARAISHSDDVNETDQQYSRSLSRVADLYSAFKAKQDAFNTKIARLNKMLDEEDESAADLRESFKQFKRELCKAAVFNRTGSTISMKKMKKIEAMELEKDRELECLRLKHIHFRNQLRKQEDAVKQKEQLSEGLHLIDFEQLKIENQTLNEKIEERNDDLHKLKKKITTTVQVLTHIKEKIDFVEHENDTLRGKLSILDNELQSKRDQMTKTKRVRDALLRGPR